MFAFRFLYFYVIIHTEDYILKNFRGENKTHIHFSMFSRSVASVFEVCVFETPTLSMFYPCFIHALSMLYPCFIHALSMLYLCFIHALSMLYLCFIHALSMFYPCFIYALSMLFLCFIYALFMLYPFFIHALSTLHGVVMLSSFMGC